MKRCALLLTLVLVGACGDDISEPAERVAVTATVTGATGEAIGAVLLSVEGAADSVAVTGGRSVVSKELRRTYVAAVLEQPAVSVAVGMLVPAGSAGSVRVLQVAGAENEVYADNTAFTVDVRED